MARYRSGLGGGASTAAANTWLQKQAFSDEIEVDGAFNHDGAAVGFFDAPPVTKRAAYTQTHSSTGRTHSNMSSSAVSTTAATNVTPFGYSTAAQADAIVTQINNLRSDVSALKLLINSVIDDLQALGLVG